MPSVQRAARSVPSRVPKMLRLLPFQRPASPEMKLSPSETMAVVVEVGPALAAGAALSAATAVNASMAASLALLICPPFSCEAGRSPRGERDDIASA